MTGKDSPLFQALDNQCGVQFVFQHQGDEAQLFARKILLRVFDPQERRFEYYEDQVVPTGRNYLVSLVDKSMSDAYGQVRGGSESTASSHENNWRQGQRISHSQEQSRGLSDSASASHTDNQQSATSTNDAVHDDMRRVARAYSTAQGNHNARGLADTNAQAHMESSTASRGRTEGTDAGVGGSDGLTAQNALNWQDTYNRATAITTKQQLVSEMANKRVLKFVELYTPEVKLMEIAGNIARQDRGEAHVISRRNGVLRVRIPMPQDPYRVTPAYGERKLQEFFEEMATRPYCEYGEMLVEENRRVFLECLEQIRRLDEGGSVQFGKTEVIDFDNEDGENPRIGI